jgi:hypothetical protein
MRKDHGFQEDPSMTAAVYPLLAVVAAGALALALFPLIKAWRKARGTRPTACPETEEPAAVEIDPVDAAFHAFLEPREVHLQSCALWSEKAGCGQACMARMTDAPDGCLVHSIFAEWCEGKPCDLCDKKLSVGSGEHQPALMSLDRVTSEWADLRVEDISGILLTHRPICWDCHVVETLQRMHPELTTGREPHTN